MKSSSTHHVVVCTNCSCYCPCGLIIQRQASWGNIMRNDSLCPQNMLKKLLYGWERAPVFFCCELLITGAEPTPEPSFRKWGLRYLEVLNETHKDKLPQYRICAVSDARGVPNNLVHCRANGTLWQMLKKGNLCSNAVKNVPNRRLVPRIRGGLCLGG